MKTRRIAAGFVIGRGDALDPEKWADHKRRCLQAQAWLRFMSMGKWEIIIDPYVVESDSYPELRRFRWQDFYDIMDNGVRAYPHWMVSGGWSTGQCGAAETGGRLGHAYPNCGWETLAHEICHLFGVLHAGAYIGGRPSPYGERWGGIMMSDRKGSRHTMNAPHFHTLGLLADEEIHTVLRTHSSEFNLVQADTHPGAVPWHTHKIALLRNSQKIRNYAVSMQDGEVRVYRPLTDYVTSFAQSMVLARLGEGEKWQDENGTVVEPLLIREQVARVRVVNQGNKDGGVSGLHATPLGFDAVMPVSQHSGLYHNPDWSGQGLHVRVLPRERREVFVAWMTWDKRFNQRWRWAVCSIGSDNVARGRLRTVKDEELADVGGCAIGFSENGEGMFRALDDELGYQHMPLHRLSQAEPRWFSGYWGLGMKEGISLEQASDGNALGYWLRENGRWCMLSNGIIYQPRYGLVSTNAEVAKEEMGRGRINPEGTIELLGRTRFMTSLA